MNDLNRPDYHIRIDHYHLRFFETNEKANTTYLVCFNPKFIIHNDLRRVVFEGDVSLANYINSNGKVEYNKETGIWRRVVFSAASTKSRGIMGNLSLMDNYRATVDDLLSFVDSCKQTPTIL